MFNTITAEDYTPAHSKVYENDTTHIEASGIYPTSSYKFHVASLLVDEDSSYVFNERDGVTVTETLKVSNIRIKTVIVKGRGTAQATKGYRLYYLDDNGVYQLFHSGTLNYTWDVSGEQRIVVPNEISTTSIRLQVVSHYSYGPALSKFFFEYEYRYSEKIKSKVIDTITQNELFQKVTSPVEII